MFTGWQEGPAWVAAGWTMIHFMWIGTAIGMLGLLLGRVALRQASPHWRYLLSLVTLVALVVAAGTIYQQQFRRVQAARLAPRTAASPGSVITKPSIREVVDVPLPVAPISAGLGRTGGAAAAANQWRFFLDILAARAPWVWLLGTPLMLLVLGIGCRGIKRLRRGSVVLAEGWVVELSERLRDSLKLTRRVSVAVSENVVTPILIGVIKPIILLPPVLLTGYSVEQVEMILLHELAHVRRWDAAVNLVQRLIEALLFFHPMVWVISRWVRAEREECCDAIVVEQTGNAEVYAEALAQLASAAPELMPVLAAARHPVVRRIRRILQLDDGRVPLPGSFVAAAVALVLMLGLPTLASLGWGGLQAGASRHNEEAAKPSDNAPANAAAPLVAMWIPDGQAGQTTPAGYAVAGTPPARERVLHFPQHRSLGQISVREAETTDDLPCYVSPQTVSGWVPFGPARGTLTIPAGKRVKLSVSGPTALQDLSPLAGLAPDDLDSVAIGCWGSLQLLADEAILPHISKLTGLRSLALEQVNVSEKGVALLGGLHSLKQLSIRSAVTQSGQAKLGRLDDHCVELLTVFKELESLCLAGEDLTDECLAQIAQLQRLQELDLWSPKLRGLGLVHLGELPLLQYLRLGGRALDDNGLAPLSGLSSLRLLDLNHVKITDAGLAYLSPLAKLEELRLYDTQIAGPGLAPLQAMRSLRRLDLGMSGGGSARLGDEGAEYLGRLQFLEHLSLFNLDFTDVGLTHLSNLTNLQSLLLPTAAYVDPKMDKFYYTDAGLEALSRLSNLEELMIGSPAITDAGLAHVAKLTRLKNLDITGRQVGNEGLRHLAGLSSLEALTLRTPGVTTSGLNALGRLVNLRKLGLNEIQQDSQGFNLSSLQELEELTISLRTVREGRSVRTDAYRDEDMAWMAELKHLRWLQGIRGISDAGMRHLAGLTALERLNVGGPEVTDTGVAWLGGLKRLNHVTVKGKISEAGLRALEGIPSLGFLYIDTEPKLPASAYNRLRAHLPDLYILQGQAMAFAAGG